MKLPRLLTSIFLVVFSVSSFANMRVAVTDFETKNYRHQRYSEFARGELENLIMSNTDVTIVERAGMDKMAEEASFSNSSGMADPTTSVAFGHMTGANIIITGSILNVNEQEDRFSGFGIDTNTKSTVATIRVRAYDAEKGTVIFSENLEGSNTSFSTNFGSTASANPESLAIQSAISELKDSQKFISMLTESIKREESVKTVKVEIAPKPNNIDVEVNGIYYGSTPMVVDLPAGSPVKVRLTKPGYSDWEMAMLPREGMVIRTELKKADTPS